MSIKDNLQSSKPVIGTWQMLYSPSISEILCDMGFSFVTIDLEHTSIGLSQAAHLIQIITLKGVTALVRLGAPDSNTIKRVMDMGADGVIIADVRTAKEAESIVKAVKYPPAGTRGVGLSRTQKYGEGFSEYVKWNQDQSVVITQIEHIGAINNLSDILSVEGIDATLIGPYDLSGSMGYPGAFERDDVKAVVAGYLETCKQHNSPAGYHVVSSDYKDLLPYIDEGYSFLPFGFDAKFMIDKCKDAMKGIREHIGENSDA